MRNTSNEITKNESLSDRKRTDIEVISSYRGVVLQYCRKYHRFLQHVAADVNMRILGHVILKTFALTDSTTIWFASMDTDNYTTQVCKYCTFPRIYLVHLEELRRNFVFFSFFPLVESHSSPSSSSERSWEFGKRVTSDPYTTPRP